MKKMSKEKGMALGIAIFMPFGIAMWLITGNPGMLGVGPAVGVAVGMAFAEQKETTAEEKRKLKILTMAGMFALVIGVIAFALIFFVL